MSTLIPSSQDPVTLQDKTPHDTPRELKSDNPSFVLHGIDKVVYEQAGPLSSPVASPPPWLTNSAQFLSRKMTKS